jgi:hypothetical protein
VSAYSSKTYANSYPILSQASSGTNEVMSAIIRTGGASVKEDSLRLFPIWNKRWLVLTGNELQIFKNEVCCFLRLRSLERANLLSKLVHPRSSARLRRCQMYNVWT